MAYQTTQNTYGVRPHMYNAAGGPNAGHFPPQSHHPFPHQQQLQQQQQQQQFYPNPYPQSAAPSPSYLQPQSSQAPANPALGQQYLPNQHGNNGGTPLMPPPSTVPDDPFKKPHLPPQRASEPQSQYMQNVQSPPFNPPYNQQQTTPTAPSISNIANTTSGETTRPPGSSSGQPTSMTAPAVPAASSGQIATPPESPSQVQPSSNQANQVSSQEQERVDALLNINNLLLQEVQFLQKAGLRPSAPAPLSSPPSKPEGTTTTPTSTEPTEAATQNALTSSTSTTPTASTPSITTPTAPSSNNAIQNQKKFVEYMGRLKANIHYLVAISDQAKQKTKPLYPSQLEPPPAWLAEGVKDEDKERFEALKEGYAKLRELWPDWKPQPRVPPQQAQQQQQQQMKQPQMKQPQPQPQQHQQALQQQS